MTTENDPPTAHEPQGYSVDLDEGAQSTPTNAIKAAAIPLPASPRPVQQPTSGIAATVAQAEGTPELPERPHETITSGDDEVYASNEQLAALHAIFPDFDASLLISVLESVNGDQDRAVDALLGMSDPEHVSAPAPEQRNEPTSQTDLDEAFARQLMLQEQEEFSRLQAAHAGRGGGWQPAASRSHPIDGLYYGPAPPEPPQQPQQQRDTLADVQDQLGKLAETGKRTFSSFMTKVKQKVQEFDQSRTTQQRDQNQAGAEDASILSWGPSQPLDRHQQAAYYAPTPAPVTASQEPSQQVPGRDYARDPVPSTTPPPPRTSSGPPAIDPGSVGMLPKRPVSLIGGDAAHSAAGRPPPDDDDEELEYVENPFEEGRR